MGLSKWNTGCSTRVQIAKRVQVDKSGADQRLAVIDAHIDVPGESLPEELDGVAREYDFRVAPYAV